MISTLSSRVNPSWQVANGFVHHCIALCSQTMLWLNTCVLLTHIGSLRSVFAVSLEFGIVLDVDDLGGKQRFD
jgi:hypothetical protein